MRGSLADVVAAMKRDVEQVPRLVFAEVASRAVTRSPVDTGAFRLNWSASIGASEARGIDTREGAPLPRRTNIGAVARAITPGDVAFFINGAAYGPRLEYGWSDQAPAGFVRVTAAEHQTITDAAVRAARGN